MEYLMKNRRHRVIDLVHLSRSNRSILLFTSILFFISIILISYLCPDEVCSLNSLSSDSVRYQSFKHKNLLNDNVGMPLPKSINPSSHKMSFDDMLSDDAFTFDIKGNDVIVFLHIQKTGGTIFGRHLVRDLDLEKPCQCKRGRKRCKCIRPDSDAKLWLFSRYSTGWRCGLHADWTELTNCVDDALDEHERESIKRRYFYITLLRDPVARFLSEFRHVQRGATWKTSLHLCNGRSPTPKELPPCYSGPDWRDVTISEFMNCPSNLAINRLTRMLADLTLVGCYNTSLMSKKERDILLLASAKENLKKMAFFGLCEFQKMSQYLFERSFHLNFLQPFVQFNETHSSVYINKLKPELLEKLRQLNYLDVELYDFATKLLHERFEKIKQIDKNFDYNFNNLGTIHFAKNHPSSPNQINENGFDNLINDDYHT